MARPHKRIDPTAQASTPGAQADSAERVLELLLMARREARRAGAVYTLPRIEAAISSARGAVRNTKHRADRIRLAKGGEQ